MSDGQNSHGHYRLCPSHMLAISRHSRESSKIGILRSTAEFVETYLLTLIRTLWYLTYAVRNVFGHMAGVSNRYRLPTFCNWPLAPWGTARWGQDWSPCTDQNVTRLTPYPQWYGPDNQNIQYNTNMNDAHPQMDVEPVIDAANAELEPPNPVHDMLTICGIANAETCTPLFQHWGTWLRGSFCLNERQPRCYGDGQANGF